MTDHDTTTDPRKVPTYMRAFLHDGGEGPKAARSRMLDALRSFESAGYNLVDAWDDDAPTDLYPFNDSFDEVCAQVGTFRESLAAAPVGELPCDHYGTALRPGQCVALSFPGASGDPVRHLLARVHAVEIGGTGRVMLAVPSATFQPGAWDLDSCEVLHVATNMEGIGTGWENLAVVVDVEHDAAYLPCMVGETVTLLALAGEPEC